MHQASEFPYAKGRRLSDKLLVAFHHACDQEDVEVAAALLPVIEQVITRGRPNLADRRAAVSLVSAYERLWHLRHRSIAHEFVDEGGA